MYADTSRPQHPTTFGLQLGKCRDMLKHVGGINRVKTCVSEGEIDAVELLDGEDPGVSVVRLRQINGLHLIAGSDQQLRLLAGASTDFQKGRPRGRKPSQYALDFVVTNCLKMLKVKHVVWVPLFICTNRASPRPASRLRSDLS